MKKMLVIIAFLLSFVFPVHATLINGGFETGTFEGWETIIPVGESEFSGMQPAGSANIVTGENYGNSPSEGLSMAAIGTGDEYFIDSQQWDITARQTVFLNTNDTLSGDSFFYNGDYEEQDSGWVRILDSSNNPVATPWIEFSGGLASGGLNSVDYLSATDWAHWEWQANQPGLYTITLGVTTFGDNTFDSYAFYDNIRINSVPEPSISFMLCIAVFVMALRGRYIF
jgi:hypothetical protein